MAGGTWLSSLSIPADHAPPYQFALFQLGPNGGEVLALSLTSGGTTPGARLPDFVAEDFAPAFQPTGTPRYGCQCRAR